jgi:hypothetical protein
LDIFATGVFAFECLRNSACNALVQLLRLSRFTFFTAFFAMHHPVDYQKVLTSEK